MDRREERAGEGPNGREEEVVKEWGRNEWQEESEGNVYVAIEDNDGENGEGYKKVSREINKIKLQWLNSFIRKLQQWLLLLQYMKHCFLYQLTICIFPPGSTMSVVRSKSRFCSSTKWLVLTKANKRLTKVNTVLCYTPHFGLTDK